MIDIDLFEYGKLRSLWYDLHGLLKTAASARDKPKRPRRKLTFAACVAGSLLSFNAATSVFAAAPPGQLSFAWPQPLTAALTKKSLLESLKRVRQLKGGWNGHSAAKPIERSVSVAEYILPQFPDIVADARAGVDADGNVFLRFSRRDKVAYVTVEPKLMHLIYMEPGQPNVYIDDEIFNGKILPASIKNVLEKRLKS